VQHHRCLYGKCYLYYRGRQCSDQLDDLHLAVH
jgi:hypothetical protein